MNEHKDEVSNKMLINKSMQMFAQNPSRGYLSANLLYKAYLRLSMSCLFIHISLSLFFISVCEPMHVCLWRERQIFAQCIFLTWQKLILCMH